MAPVIKGAESIDLREEGSHGVLLLHGFGDTPQTLSGLARYLQQRGNSVFAPLLPGHGRSMEAFTQSGAVEWMTAARDAEAEMRRGHPSLSVVGLSMGGALAVIVGAEDKSIESLVLIAPYLGMPRLLQIAALGHWSWGRFAGQLNARNPRSIRDPVEREKSLAYGQVTARGLYELSKVVRQARRALRDVTQPTLLIQSREDPRIAPVIAERSMKTIGAKEKKLVWTEGAGHVITVDFGRERVFAETARWIESHRDNTAGLQHGRDSR